MSVLGRIKSFFTVNRRSKNIILNKDIHEYEKEKVTRTVCARYARGNISLQNGLHITSHDIREQRKEALSYNFQVLED